MKNEALMRAITGLDEDLILSASARDGPTEKRKKGSAYPQKRILSYLGGVAACLLFAVAIGIFAHMPEGLLIEIDGQPLNNTAVVLKTEQDASPIARYSLQDVVSVPLVIHAEKETVIRTDDGQLEVKEGTFSAVTGEDSAIRVSGAVCVNWTLVQPDSRMTYQMEIGSRKLLLAFDTDLNCWTISKE